MRALDIANYLIDTQYDNITYSNLSLNKLLYFAQMYALKEYNTPLYPDEIKAWRYGPVIESVYSAFKLYGSCAITAPTYSVKELPSNIEHILNKVINDFGKLSAFDLVQLTHKRGSAWSMAYSPDKNNSITLEDIMKSEDMNIQPIYTKSFSFAFQESQEKLANTLRLLADA